LKAVKKHVAEVLAVIETMKGEELNDAKEKATYAVNERIVDRKPVVDDDDDGIGMLYTCDREKKNKKLMSTRVFVVAYKRPEIAYRKKARSTRIVHKLKKMIKSPRRGSKSGAPMAMESAMFGGPSVGGRIFLLCFSP
jgi:hypothetical protein